MSAQTQLQKLQEEANETIVTVSQKESDLLELRNQLVEMGEQECECLDRLSCNSTAELNELQQIQFNLEQIKTRIKSKEDDLHVLLKRLPQLRTLESKWEKILADSVRDKDNDEPTTVVAWRYGPLSTTTSQLKKSEVPTEVEKGITVRTETEVPPATARKLPTASSSSYADLLADSIDLCSRSKKKELRKLSKNTEAERRAKNNEIQPSKSSLSYGDVMAESLHLCSDIVLEDDKNKKSDGGGGSSGSTNAALQAECDSRKRTYQTNPAVLPLVDKKRELKRAGGMSFGKGQEEDDEEEEEEEGEEEERFVRPPRLRFAVLDEAAKDGFPSPIACSHQWHPDFMSDLPGDTNLSIREAFDNKFDEYYVFRHWRPSQGMPPIHNVRLRWRTIMLMIAGHLDCDASLTRVVCMSLELLPGTAFPNNPMDTSSTGNKAVTVSSYSESLQKNVSSIASVPMSQHQGLVVDIEAIKWCYPEQPLLDVAGEKSELDEKEQLEERKPLSPVIFVRYAVTDSAQESLVREAIDNSKKELSDQGISQRRISCWPDEIQYVVSLLQEQEACVDEAYRTLWKEKSMLNGTVFRLSLLRPTLEPLFPHRTAELKRLAERQARKEKRIEQRAHQQQRIERMIKLQKEEQLRKDEVQMRRDWGEIVDKVCCKIGCEEWALLQCSRCPNAWYCRFQHGKHDWKQRHGEVCMSEQYMECALPSCLVRVLVGYSDPNRPSPVNEETTLRRNLMDAASESDAPVLRHFCSQSHCQEGKQDDEVTLKEYNLEIERKEKELSRREGEYTADISHFDKQMEDCQEKIDELDEVLKREHQFHQIRLSDLKKVVYQSKKTLKEMAEMMKQSTIELEWIFRKKILEIERDKDEQDRLRTESANSIIFRRMVHLEECEVFFREKYGRKSNEVLNQQRSKESLQTCLHSHEEHLRTIEDRQMARNKELDTINKALNSKDNSTSAAATSERTNAGSSQQKDSPFKTADGVETIGTCNAGTTTAATALTTSAITATASATDDVGLKQGGVSLSSIDSKDTTVVSCCSHPDYSLPGTSFCGACKSSPYCSSKCQTSDWPRHKESCEGQLRKVGVGHLLKAKSFFLQRNWAHTVHYADLALVKLKQLKDRRLGDCGSHRRSTAA